MANKESCKNFVLRVGSLVKCKSCKDKNHATRKASWGFRKKPFSTPWGSTNRVYPQIRDGNFLLGERHGMFRMLADPIKICNADILKVS